MPQRKKESGGYKLGEWLRAMPLSKMFPTVKVGKIIEIMKNNPGKEIDELASIVKSNCCIC